MLIKEKKSWRVYENKLLTFSSNRHSLLYTHTHMHTHSLQVLLFYDQKVYRTPALFSLWVHIFNYYHHW